MLTVVLLSFVASLIADATPHYSIIRAAAGGKKSWKPTYRIIAVQFRKDKNNEGWDEPCPLIHGKWIKKTYNLPKQIPQEWRVLLEDLVEELSKGRFYICFNALDEDNYLEKLSFMQQHGFEWYDAGGSSCNTHMYFSDQCNKYDMVLNIEGWCGMCVDEGLGPWSSLSYIPDVSATSPCSYEPNYLAYAIAESELRASVVKAGEPDGPPAKAKEWLLDFWCPYKDPDGEFVLAQVSLWRVNKED